jgi:hypothetical protein
MLNQIMVIYNRYTILAITAGITLVLLTILSYLAIWQPRVDKKYWITQASRWRDAFASVPWVLVIIYVGTTIMAIITVIYYVFNPPNW